MDLALESNLLAWQRVTACGTTHVWGIVYARRRILQKALEAEQALLSAAQKRIHFTRLTVRDNDLDPVEDFTVLGLI